MTNKNLVSGQPVIFEGVKEMNLTEQWKKGELPNGWYYVRLIRGEHRIDLYINSKNEWIDCPDDIIDTVVGVVPSCELWKAVHEQWKVAVKENAQLKAVLKRCREFVDDFSTDNDERWAYKNAVLNGIDELLGEE